jgi:predicted ferric reductase
MDEPITLIDVSSYLGLTVTGGLLINVLLGLTIATRVVSTPWWKRLPKRIRSLNILRLHRWTAYLALGLALLHPIPLLIDDKAGFKVIDVLFPAWSPHQNIINSLGALSLYLLLFTVITSLDRVRKKLRFKTWRLLHFITYVLTPLFLLHGLLIDQTLKDQPVDYIDAEKILSEFGLLLFAVLLTYRVRYSVKQKATRAMKHAGRLRVQVP